MKHRARIVIGLALVALVGGGVFALLLASSGEQGANTRRLIERTRQVDLKYDAAETMVLGSFDTTVAADEYVTTVGSGGRGLWGESTMERDPSGGVGQRVSDDPSGTVYSFTVTWYDAQRSPTASITRTLTKP